MVESYRVPIQFSQTSEAGSLDTDVRAWLLCPSQGGKAHVGLGGQGGRRSNEEGLRGRMEADGAKEARVEITYRGD